MSNKKPSGSAGFDEFWNVYPRCVAKMLTKKAYERALKRGHTHSEIMAGLKAYTFSGDPEMQPHSTTWLNQDRFQGIILRDAPTISGASSRLSWRDRYDHGAGVLTGLGADRVSGSMATGPGAFGNAVSRSTGPTGFRQNGQERITGPVVSGQRGNQADFDEGEFPF